MQQIADWLKKLGMSEYAERFAESDIDIDVLSELTDHDFDRLGVSLGHRRKMLRAIRELTSGSVLFLPSVSRAVGRDTRRPTTVRGHAFPRMVWPHVMFPHARMRRGANSVTSAVPIGSTPPMPMPADPK